MTETVWKKSLRRKKFPDDRFLKSQLYFVFFAVKTEIQEMKRAFFAVKTEIQEMKRAMNTSHAETLS